MKPKTWTAPKFKQCAKLLRGADVVDGEELLAGLLERLWFTVGTFDAENGGSGRVPDFYFAGRPEVEELLIRFRWIDKGSDGSLFVHNWAKHKVQREDGLTMEPTGD